MNIVIVSQYFYPENFRINDLALEFTKKGNKVTVLTGLPNYPKGKFFEGYKFRPYIEMQGDIKVIRSPLIPRGDNSKVMLLLNYLSFPFIASFLSLLCLKEPIDRIFVYGASPIFLTIPAIVLKFFSRAPLTLWIQDLWPESLSASGMVKNRNIISIIGFVTSLIYAACDQILVTSKGFMKSVEHYDRTNTPIKYFPQWGETLFEEQVKVDNIEVEKIFPPGFNILFAGNIGFAQNLGIVIEAAKKLKNIPEINFVLVGDGRERSNLEKLVLKNKLSNVYFPGSFPIEMMPTFFHYADVLFLSLIEDEMLSLTIPGKIQAYLASGKPIITAVTGAASELIQEANAGLTGTARDVDALVENIKVLYKMNEHERNQLGANAINYYQNNFKRDALMEKLMGYLSYQGVE